MSAALATAAAVLGFAVPAHPVTGHHSINLVGTGRVVETVAMRRRRAAKIAVVVMPSTQGIRGR